MKLNTHPPKSCLTTTKEEEVAQALWVKLPESSDIDFQYLQEEKTQKLMDMMKYKEK